jgi:crotonobetainyl-CoA:carnitine CoA-transferase CaiB-like acyl-CoA transferase
MPARPTAPPPIVPGSPDRTSTPAPARPDPQARGAASRVPPAPPARGAHTHEILAEFGLTPEEVAALEAADAI